MSQDECHPAQLPEVFSEDVCPEANQHWEAYVNTSTHMVCVCAFACLSEPCFLNGRCDEHAMHIDAPVATGELQPGDCAFSTIRL